MKQFFTFLFFISFALDTIECKKTDMPQKSSDEMACVDDCSREQNEQIVVLEEIVLQREINSKINRMSSQASKRALIIGLGEQIDRNWAKINGDKDVPFVREMLENAGYTDVRTLINKQATKANIIDAFMKLTKRCTKGDVVYVHFSGHGQLVTDVNGDEEDGWDESWIPYDAYLTYCDNDKGEKHLIDDEISGLLTAVKDKIGDEGKLLVVVDACHSGDSSKGDDDEVVRGVMDEFVIPVKKVSKSSQVPERWLTLSACQDFQLNQELKNPRVGKLTYALYTATKKENISFNEIEKFMDSFRSSLPQNPVLTGETGLSDIKDFF